MDDINLSETECPHHVVRLRHFRDNAESNSYKYNYSPRLFSSDGYGYQLVIMYRPRILAVFFRLASGDSDNVNSYRSSAGSEVQYPTTHV